MFSSTESPQAPGGRLIRRALCLVRALGLIAVLAWALPVQAQSVSEPALRFTSPTAFHVHPSARLRPRDVESHRDWVVTVGDRQVYSEGFKNIYFGALTGEQSGEGHLTFAVEGQSGEVSTYCFRSNCGAVQVRVFSAEESGLLHLGVDSDAPLNNNNNTLDTGKLRSVRGKFTDFPGQRVEVSVQSGQQKVYQEVGVNRPAAAPDCSDYPTKNEDRYRCYYTPETMPAAFAVANSPLVAELPGQLLQDREEYELVFAEEFEGSYTTWSEWSDNCDRGLAELDGSKWNYVEKSCRPDPQGVPCEYLENGHLHVSTTSQCGGGVDSLGIFEPRYGYVEMRYTVGARISLDRPNYNVVMGDPRMTERHLLNTHNLSLNSLERVLTLVPWLELDLVEYNVRNRSVISHQYRNWAPFTHHDAVRPMLSYKLRYVCGGGEHCTGIDRLTITEGMEWTPGGYLFLRRIHGREDELQVIPQNKTWIFQSPGKNDLGEWRYGYGMNRRQLFGRWREPYFVPLDPSTPSLYLEALGISHAPLHMSIGTWNSHPRPLTTQSELTIDYIRVFQPRNRYADMEPLYQ